MPSRISQIEEIINDLKDLRSNEPSYSAYAINANLQFFESLKKISSYLTWFRNIAPALDGNQLLELADFAIPKWDEELHRRLVEVSRKKFPGMVEPLRKILVKHIVEQSPHVIADLGSGGMEVERQVIHTLEEVGHTQRLIFIGVDRSPSARAYVEQNFADTLELVDIIQAGRLTKASLESYLRQVRDKHLVIICDNDIFQLDKDLGEYALDVAFHVRFKHHVPKAQHGSLDDLLRRLAQTVYEFDEYKDFKVMIPQSIFTWQYPTLMNGALFSRLREKTKSEVLSEGKGLYRSVTFFKLLGAYLKTYSKKN